MNSTTPSERSHRVGHTEHAARPGRPGSADDPAPAQMQRRSVLKVAGLAGAGAAVLALGRPTPAAATGAGSAEGVVGVAATVADLADRQAEDGDVIVVAGYREPGDGGGMTVRWFAGSDAAANGGTVLAGPSSNGRWHQIHDGVGDFRRFGILDASTPADDALEAMAGDESFHRIEARTDLNFVRRHTFFRSNLTLDFGGHRVTAEGIEPNVEPIREYGAVLAFAGRRGETTQTVTLSRDMPELTDVYEVTDSSFFTEGHWYEVISDLPPGGFDYSADQELQRMVQVTEILDRTRIRVNYKNGWNLAAGREIYWTPVEPVEGIRVENMRFRGPGGDADTGAHPIAFRYAVRCDIDRIDATRSYWSLCMRGYNTYFTTSRCTLSDPVDAAAGGAGYLTQQMYSLYGRVADCHTSRARHLVDFTACAYCLVENCHGDGDVMGPFVTHGQYEHDLTYTGNSGMMTFANSGQKWGSWIKRVTVRKHVGPLFFSGRKGPTIEVKAVDLTLEDVEIIRDPDMYAAAEAYPAWGWVNADGLQMRGCRVDDSFHIYQNSSVSRRPTIIDGCYIGQEEYYTGLPFIDASVTSTITFSATTIAGLTDERTTVVSRAPLVFADCTLRGSGEGSTLTLPSESVRLVDTRIEDLGIVLAGEGDQRLELAGSVVFGGSPGATAFLSRADGGGDIDWQLDGYDGSADAGEVAHVVVDRGTNHYRAVGARFAGGRLRLEPEAFSGGSLLHSGNVEQGVTRTAMPSTGDGVLVEGNLLR